MKKDFYVFLDIDGVLWDWEFFKSLNKKVGIINIFNPKSVEALNYLLLKLEQNYNPIIVITSSWRNDMNETEEALVNNGVKFSNELKRTRLTQTPFYRGKEIKRFLEENGNCKNYVIIDDEISQIVNLFPKCRIIETSLLCDSLSIEKVNSFLSKINIKKDNNHEF